MTSSSLDNLVRVGQLKTEPPTQAEFDGLVRSGRVRLADAGNPAIAQPWRAASISLTMPRTPYRSRRSVGMAIDRRTAIRCSRP